MIFMFAQNRQHVDTWCRLNCVHPKSVGLIDHPSQLDGMNGQVILRYHTFWRRPDANRLNDYARARHNVIVVDVPEKIWAD